jgi:hypothetical protein
VTACGARRFDGVLVLAGDARLRVSFDREDDTSPSVGIPMMVRGPLEGRTMHEGFAPFGWRPVRQAQTWPLLGRAPMFSPYDLGGFRFGPKVRGVWSRPIQAHPGVVVGLLDGKASVDLARPEPNSSVIPATFAREMVRPARRGELVTVVGLAVAVTVLAVRRGRRER